MQILGPCLVLNYPIDHLQICGLLWLPDAWAILWLLKFNIENVELFGYLAEAWELFSVLLPVPPHVSLKERTVQNRKGTHWLEFVLATSSFAKLDFFIGISWPYYVLGYTKHTLYKRGDTIHAIFHFSYESLFILHLKSIFPLCVVEAVASWYSFVEFLTVFSSYYRELVLRGQHLLSYLLLFTKLSALVWLLFAELTFNRVFLFWLSNSLDNWTFLGWSDLINRAEQREMFELT